MQVRDVARGGVEPPTFRFSGGRSYQLSYLAPGAVRPTCGTTRGPDRSAVNSATPTGFEPATSAVTGRRANQLRYGALRTTCGRNSIARTLHAPSGIPVAPN